jgi:ribosome modulation factor
MRGSEFWAGYDAHDQGLGRSACPYPTTTSRAENWLDGWSSDAVSIMEGIARDARAKPPFQQALSLKTVILL